MGKKLSNAPVYYTVAQVQFNPVLGLDSYVPAIQAKMRDAHFPDFKKEVFQRLDFPVLGMQQGQMLPPTITTQARYVFGDIAGQTAFLLEANALTLQTTSYDTFETFSKYLIAALGVLHSVLRLDFVFATWMRFSRSRTERPCVISWCPRCLASPYVGMASFSSPSARRLSRPLLDSSSHASSSATDKLAYQWS